MSQDRMDKPSEPAKATTGYQAPNIDASLSRATSAMKKVRVVHGANEQYFDNLEGKTVGMVRKSLRDIFNIPGDAEALIGGKKVGDDFILEGGQNLEFVKEAGVKGVTVELSDDEALLVRWALTEIVFEGDLSYDAPYSSELLEGVLKRLGGEQRFAGYGEPLENTEGAKQWRASREMCESCDRWVPKDQIKEYREDDEDESFTYSECDECHKAASTPTDWEKAMQQRMGDTQEEPPGYYN